MTLLTEQLVKNASGVARVQATASAVQTALAANKNAIVLATQAVDAATTCLR